MSAVGQFGSYYLMGFSGYPKLPTMGIQKNKRNGVNGADYQLTGTMPKPGSVILRFDAPIEAWNLAIYTVIAASVGIIIDPITLNGKTFTGWRLMDVDEPNYIEMAGAVGGVYGGKYVMELTVTLEAN